MLNRNNGSSEQRNQVWQQCSCPLLDLTLMYSRNAVVYNVRRPLTWVQCDACKKWRALGEMTHKRLAELQSQTVRQLTREARSLALSLSCSC